MDAGTRSVYESSAARWLERRRAQRVEQADALGRSSGGPSVDLGCGPGWHAAALAPPVVALDAVRAMLDLVPERAPGAWRVQADLGALPFRRGALGAAWAHHSYVHVPRHELPLALADLHRSLRPGARVALRVFAGDGEGPLPDDDFPGRFFSFWPPERLGDVVVGAGFVVERLAVIDDAIKVEARRARTLPDYVSRDLRLLLCGLNPSQHAADAGVGFVTPSNRFWPSALQAGVVTVDRDPWHAVRVHGVGFTDLVKRATARAGELDASEYRDGFGRVERLAGWLQPAVVCFVGLAGWRAAVDRRAVAGWQERSVGGRPAYVMPNPSGLNARSTPADLATHLRTALHPPHWSLGRAERA